MPDNVGRKSTPKRAKRTQTTGFEKNARKGSDGQKKSGIVKDANDYAKETMHNPAYLLELFQRVIMVSLESKDSNTSPS